MAQTIDAMSYTPDLQMEAPFLQLPDWGDLPVPANVRACYTTRAGGVSMAPYDDGQGGGGLNLGSHVGDAPQAVAQNRARLHAALLAGLAGSAPASLSTPLWLNQVHGTRVLNAADHAPGRMQDGEKDGEAADASFSTRANTVCCIMTADCLPVLFCDSAGRVVAAAHAGWRGLAAGVLQNTVAAMRSAGANEIFAWLGPAIGPQHFEVGAEVRAAFLPLLAAADVGPEQAFVPVLRNGLVLEGKFLANIWLLARLSLQQVGVTQIAGGTQCTVSEAARFYSYRRDHVTGRMASLIYLQDQA